MSSERPDQPVGDGAEGGAQGGSWSGPGDPGQTDASDPGWALPPSMRPGPSQPNVLSGGTPAPNTSPGWGPPPAAPGWGPPPAGPGQTPGPGWGSPLAAPGQTPGWYGQGQAPAGPGWGTGPGQQPGGYPPGYSGAYPGWIAPPRKSNRGCLIAIIAVVIVIALGVGGCVLLVVNTVGPAIALELDIQNQSAGQIQSVSYSSTNGYEVFNFTLAPGVTALEGRQIACDIVVPRMRGTKFEDAHFVIYDSSGVQVASDRTPCG